MRYNRGMASIGETVVKPARCTAGSLSADALSAWVGLLQVHEQLSRALDARLQREHRISLSAFEVLWRLEEAPDQRLVVSRLAAVTGLSQSQASRTAAELERRGLVDRLPCPRDSRSVHVALTGAGKAELEAARATYDAEVRESFVEPLGDATLASLARAWLALLPDGLRSGCAG
jgi:DNA-binding MarR family transcriptional regulator